MSFLDKLKGLFGSGGTPRDEAAEPPPGPGDPLGTTPGPLAGTTPPLTPPSAPREDETP